MHLVPLTTTATVIPHRAIYSIADRTTFLLLIELYITDRHIELYITDRHIELYITDRHI